MKAEDLTSMGAALAFFRGKVASLADDVEQAANSPAAQREIEAEGWEPPPWVTPGQWRANARLLDTGAPVLRRVLDGWTPPNLDDVLSLETDVDENELARVRLAFTAAAAAVAVEVAAHGRATSRTLEDRTHFRRVEPGHFPKQAAARVPAACEALTAYAVRWLKAVGSAPGVSFLPNGGRR